MQWPPGNSGNREGACSNAPFPKLLNNSQQNNSGSVIAQHLCGSELIWRRWCLEGRRLFSEYWRSGDLKHFHAFGRHIDAMRTYGGPRK